jgi:hypothetical protein
MSFSASPQGSPPASRRALLIYDLTASSHSWEDFTQLLAADGQVCNTMVTILFLTQFVSDPRPTHSSSPFKLQARDLPLANMKQHQTAPRPLLGLRLSSKLASTVPLQ